LHFLLFLIVSSNMKRAASSDEKKSELTTRQNEVSFKKRKVEMGKETRALILYGTFLEVFPNICARSIEIEGNYRTVSLLAQVCKGMQQRVNNFVRLISTYFCEETFLVKNDAIPILEALLIHQAIRDQLIIDNLIKDLTMTFFDSKEDSLTRTNAVIAAMNTIGLADQINLDPTCIAALLNRMMNVLKKSDPNEERVLNFHGYIFGILNKFHDKKLIQLTDLDQDVLKKYPFKTIMKNANILPLCRSNACLLYCKLVNNSLITINEDKMARILNDAVDNYPDINMSIDAFLSLDALVFPKNRRLNIGQAEFLRKYKTEKFCIQSFEESKDMIDSLCDLYLNDAECISFVERDEFIARSIFPITTDLEESTPKFVQRQVLILVALKNDLTVAIDRLSQSNANAIEKLIKVGLEMFNDPESSPCLKASILDIILCYMSPRFKQDLPMYSFMDNYLPTYFNLEAPLKHIHEHSFFYEIAGSLHELALSVINSNEYALAKIYYYAQRNNNSDDFLRLHDLALLLNAYAGTIYSSAQYIVDMFSTYNILLENSDSSESSDDFSETQTDFS